MSRLDYWRDLFKAEPTLRLLGVHSWDQALTTSVLRRAAIAVLLGWFPLAFLSILQSVVFQEWTVRSFFGDFSVFSRFVIAVPLLVLAEPDCIPRLGFIARHFMDAGFVKEQDRHRYQYAVDSTRALLSSGRAGVAVLVVAFGFTMLLLFTRAPQDVQAWQQYGDTGLPPFSLAGWWHVLMSLPLLLFLLFSWLWRLGLWWRFLVLIARLDLKLVASHPDRTGGLAFLSTSLRGFRFVAGALGAIVAGMIMNSVIHRGAALTEFYERIIVLVIVVVVCTAGPLLVFVGVLRVARRRGMFQYGSLAGGVGREFEQKWISTPGSLDEGVLQIQDFSATTDLYQVVENVYAMKDLPFDLKQLSYVVVATLLPFVPVVLMSIPIKVVVEELARLLL
jgi:hypothetical protein